MLVCLALAFTPKTPLSLLFAILWIVPVFFCVQHSYSLMIVLFTFFAFPIIYVKYAFLTIEDNFKLCLNCRNSKLVIKMIAEHQKVVQLCEDVNHLCKYVNFILYFLCSPIHMLNIYFILDPNAPTLNRVLAAWIFIFAFSLIFGVILLNSQITKTAHRPRLFLYKYLCQDSLPFKHRMKIMAFIEKLCGPDIGFYCLDLFSLNSYEFYKYCAFCVSFYIMVSGFLQF